MDERLQRLVFVNVLCVAQRRVNASRTQETEALFTNCRNNTLFRAIPRGCERMSIISKGGEIVHTLHHTTPVLGWTVNCIRGYMAPPEAL